MSRYDNYSLREYGRMINDRGRTSPFVEALRRAVQPDSVVVDIGTGTGIFAFLACQFGAARVYAIEPDDAIQVAKACAALNPGSERIVWLQAFSTEIELPERADVLIADLHGSLPFHTANLTSMIDARRRHLKPGGQVIPGRDLLRAVPANAPEEYEDLHSPWHANDYGIDFSAGQGYVYNSIWRASSVVVAAERLLSAPATWGIIDYSTVESPNLAGHVEWGIERAGKLHGLYVWFDAEVAAGLGFSNAPDLPSLPYGRSFLPLGDAVEVIQGDRMTAHISATLVGGEYVFRWDTRIVGESGKLKAGFKQTTFKGRPLRVDMLRRAEVDFVPVLNLEGQIDGAAIKAMAESQPLGKIAGELAARYPKRFSDLNAALGYVARLSAKYAQ